MVSVCVCARACVRLCMCACLKCIDNDVSNATLRVPSSSFLTYQPVLPGYYGPPDPHYGGQQHQNMAPPQGQYYQPPIVTQPTTTTVVINQMQPDVRAQKYWSSGLCACFDDCGICMLPLLTHTYLPFRWFRQPSRSHLCAFVCAQIIKSVVICLPFCGSDYQLIVICLPFYEYFVSSVVYNCQFINNYDVLFPLLFVFNGYTYLIFIR